MSSPLTLPDNNDRYSRFWWRIHPSLRERIELHISNARKLHALSETPPTNANDWRDRTWLRETSGLTKTAFCQRADIKIGNLTRWETGPVKLNDTYTAQYGDATKAVALEGAENHLALAAVNLWEADRGGTKIHEQIPQDEDLEKWLTTETARHSHMLTMN